MPRIPGLRRVFRLERKSGLSDDELDDELRFHLAARVDDLVAGGMTATGAHRVAAEEFGDLSRYRDETRAIDKRFLREIRMRESLAAFRDELRFTIRALAARPGFSLVAIATLALGLGATTAVFSAVNAVLLAPLPYGHPDRLVGAWHDLRGVSIHKANQTLSTYHTYQRFARSLAAIAIYQEGSANVSDPRGAAEPERVRATLASASLFDVLELHPLLGRVFSAAEDVPNGPDVVVISEDFWRSQLGADPRVLDRTLEVDGRRTAIIGVMPRKFRFPSSTSALWLPLKVGANQNDPGGFNYNAVARLAPGATPQSAASELASVLPRIVEVSPFVAPGIPMSMLLNQAKPLPLLIPLKEDLTEGIARTLWIVMAAAGLVLLVACANVTNLILVRTDARHRELAVREALGAGRGRVLIHFFAESATLTGAACALGLALAALAVRVLVHARAADIPRLAEARIDPVTIAFALLTALAVAAVCSAVPALRLGRAQLSDALREGGRGGTVGRGRQRVRSALVAAQIALALVAIAGSALLVRTFQRLNAVRPGFDAEHVSTFWMSVPPARYANDSAVVRFYTQLLDGVRQIPGVEDAAITSHLPLKDEGMNANPVFPENDARYTDRLPPLQMYATVDGGYFHAMRIPLLAGRTFDRLDAARGDEAIVSRAVAQQFWNDSTGRSVIGKRFRNLPAGGGAYTVIGVVGDVHDTALASPPSRTVYFAEVPAASEILGQTMRTLALVVRSRASDGAVASSVQRVVRELDPTLPLYDVRPMSDVVRASMAQLSFMIIMLGGAAIVTLLLGAIGLYGVMAYVVTLRTRELGVRIALGASPRSLIAMLTRQGIALTGVGLVAGFAIFAVLARYVRAVLFGIEPSDPVALGGAALVLIAIAALASWLPARRTARLDPVDVLRAE